MISVDNDLVDCRYIVMHTYVRVFLGFEIPDADYDKLYTVQAVVDYLMKKMNIVERVKPVVSSASDPRYDDHHH
jgi:hypothetical protein